MIKEKDKHFERSGQDEEENRNDSDIASVLRGVDRLHFSSRTGITQESMTLEEAMAGYTAMWRGNCRRTCD